MKKRRQSKFKMIQQELVETIRNTNKYINILGEKTSAIHKAISELQNRVDDIRNIPSSDLIKLQELKEVRVEWENQVDKIEKDFKMSVGKHAGTGVAGASAGVAVATLGPTVAMGIATTFGVASTGTAISTLSGAAATNAALAWVGGGALAAGGGGTVAGQALLALAGPIGWAIAGITIVGSGLLFWRTKSNKDKLENNFSLIGKRDINKYKLAIVELKERIDRIEDEMDILGSAIKEISTFGTDYNKMTERQQYELGAYVNLMNSSTQLLVNPIMGLQPNITEDDFNNYATSKNTSEEIKRQKMIIVSLSNMLFEIELDQNEQKLIWKSLKRDKKFLHSMNITKKQFPLEIMKSVEGVLDYKKQ